MEHTMVLWKKLWDYTENLLWKKYATMEKTMVQ